MKKNLNVSTFRNGDTIPQAKTDEEWIKAGQNRQPAWCYYNNDSRNGEKYGKLYNWYAISDSRELAPDGWHVPSEDELIIMYELLGDDAGKKMKSSFGWSNYTNDGYKTCPYCKNWSVEYRKKSTMS